MFPSEPHLTVIPQTWASCQAKTGATDNANLPAEAVVLLFRA